MTSTIQTFSFEESESTDLLSLEDNSGFVELENHSGSVALSINNTNIQNKINSALIWRFNNATRLKQLINAQAQWYATNYDIFWRNWYDNVFNLKTANEFGLSEWAILLGLPIEIDIFPDPADKPIFGFGPDTGSWSDGYAQNFFNANFTNGSGINALTVPERRFLLQLRYFQLQSRGSTAEINAFLPTIIDDINDGSGTLYCVDNLDMSITYVFTFTPDPRLIPILLAYDVLPRPAGVSLSITTP